MNWQIHSDGSGGESSLNFGAVVRIQTGFNMQPSTTKLRQYSKARLPYSLLMYCSVAVSL